MGQARSGFFGAGKMGMKMGGQGHRKQVHPYRDFSTDVRIPQATQTIKKGRRSTASERRPFYILFGF
jgi:hypothetical protein